MEKKHVSKQKKHNAIDDALWTKIERYFPHAKHKRKYKQKDVFNVGIDGGKKVKGRKRHIAVDSLGLPSYICYCR